MRLQSHRQCCSVHHYLTNLSYSIDGTDIQQYIHIPDGTEAQILYSVPVFSHADLLNRPHTLEMRVAGPNASLILFDVVLYTVPEEPAPPDPPSSLPDIPKTTGAPQSSSVAAKGHHTPSVGAIVGLVTGLIGLGLIAFLLLRLLINFRRRRGYRESDGSSVLQYHA
ncbi:hypothetical protein C8Q73DRAFT_364836 [Cubamyces lactineus]|nr:hypothetical protein C8Q73DRAFT_364836 [Cubamyces lactineus]